MLCQHDYPNCLLELHGLFYAYNTLILSYYFCNTILTDNLTNNNTVHSF